ncbi:MAG: Peptidase [Candidatus Woesebacteria bacterium GW2011_GWA2_40_7]|uniref:Peptidase n=1 Tax=Candidatus Woesebacteria bacterium GW2011_GWA2_40_7 TaxID=1618562 RepID=A0A0G0TB80_9BACT|nr:MAG: Peptidase [Candidatus Woesebacteria bacterium GW2011_GWA2_40_7]
MRKFILPIYYILIPVIFILIGWFANVAWNLPRNEKNIISEIKPRPLDKYSIENLSSVSVKTSQIEIGRVIKDYPTFTSYEFSLNFDPTLTNGPKKKVSGLINIPKSSGPFPIIVMFRGYVDQKQYVIGTGTQHAGEFFAQNEFITIAPDFLGYGDSDSEAGDIFESRFQTYTTALTLIKSVEALKTRSLKVGSNYINVDTQNVHIWAHSNGGQIALAVLEITGKLADFMGDYDVTKYSIRSYLDKINPNTKMQIHHGLVDDAVPIVWTDSLVKRLKDLKLNISYLKYPGADHNLTPSWQKAVENSLTFFKSSTVVE